jgi:glycosyltransferase involved in cell wall biosynthesis
LFSDGVEGYIIPVANSRAILEKLQMLAEDPALQQRLSEAALARVRFLGGWKTYGDRWENFLYQLTGAPPPTK